MLTIYFCQNRPVREYGPVGEQVVKDSPTRRHLKYELPLPHGIDHEVPRWSAIYSMFSEVMRIIPPERIKSKSDRRCLPASSYFGFDRKSGYSASGDQPRPSSRSQTFQQKANTTAQELENTNSKVANGVLQMPTHPIPRQDIRPMPFDHTDSSLFLGELDALLRF